MCSDPRTIEGTEGSIPKPLLYGGIPGEGGYNKGEVGGIFLFCENSIIKSLD